MTVRKTKSGAQPRRQVHPALSACGALAVALVAWGMLRGALDLVTGAKRLVIVLVAVLVTDRLLIPLCVLLVGARRDEEAE